MKYQNNPPSENMFSYGIWGRRGVIKVYQDENEVYHVWEHQKKYEDYEEEKWYFLASFTRGDDMINYFYPFTRTALEVTGHIST